MRAWKKGRHLLELGSGHARFSSNIHSVEYILMGCNETIYEWCLCVWDFACSKTPLAVAEHCGMANK